MLARERQVDHRVDARAREALGVQEALQVARLREVEPLVRDLASIRRQERRLGLRADADHERDLGIVVQCLRDPPADRRLEVRDQDAAHHARFARRASTR